MLSFSGSPLASKPEVASERAREKLAYRSAKLQLTEIAAKPKSLHDRRASSRCRRVFGQMRFAQQDSEISSSAENLR